MVTHQYIDAKVPHTKAMVTECLPIVSSKEKTKKKKKTKNAPFTLFGEIHILFLLPFSF